VFNRRVPDWSAITARRWCFVIPTVSFLLASPALAGAQTALPPVTVGAGLQTSFLRNEPDEGDGTNTFALDHARLYVNGSATKNIKFMFNTDYTAADNDLNILDAVARVEISNAFNVWFGRFLPPSDRANLYGPFYANHWGVYSDGVQDGYPFVYQGRDNGVAYWGQFGKVKVSGGIFDGSSATGGSDDTLISAARVQVDFWDPEGGYYLNGTYYGDKNLLAIGGAVQSQGSGRSAYNVDFLLERKIKGGGAATVEAEWAKYDSLGGYSANYRTDDGGYVLGAYVFPKLSGPGRFQILGKFAKARFRDGITPLNLDFDQKTTEINLNYLIKQFDARVMIFYKDTRFDAVRTNFAQFGVGMQIQM
jgi:hypothetical protein